MLAQKTGDALKSAKIIFAADYATACFFLYSIYAAKMIFADLKHHQFSGQHFYLHFVHLVASLGQGLRLGISRSETTDSMGRRFCKGLAFIFPTYLSADFVDPI